MMNQLDSIARTLLFKMNPEFAHGMSIRGLKLYQASDILPDHSIGRFPELSVKLAGLNFPGPLGMAAGFDKNGEVPVALLKMGFGFAEIGTVTPLPQVGNPRPRIFRLEKDGAVINRLGFNNQGHARVLSNLQSCSFGKISNAIIGVNIGANKDSADFIADYELGLQRFWEIADYFTINVSSPNTPGLRDLQQNNSLSELLGRVENCCNKLHSLSEKSPPIFLKIAPDLDERGIEGIAKNIQNSSVSGLIISNTTVSRSNLKSQTQETGGLSGQPLFDKSTIVLAKMRKIVGKEMPIIGVGGIDSVQTAWEKFEAGANLIQLYTGMVYQGPNIASTICQGLSERLKTSQYSNITELTASKTEEWAAKYLLQSN